MLQQIVESIVGLVLVGVVVLFALSFLSPLGLWWLWPSWGPRQEERGERVIIVNNTPPPQPAGPSAWALLAPAVVALLVALTRRVESQPQALPAPDDSWVEVEPGRWIRTRQTALARRYDD